MGEWVNGVAFKPGANDRLGPSKPITGFCDLSIKRAKALPEIYLKLSSKRPKTSGMA
jgi:hypothetical protein